MFFSVPLPQAVQTAVTDLYARHVNQVAEDKTVPSDTRPAVSEAEMEKEFGRQVGGPGHTSFNLCIGSSHTTPHVYRRKTAASSPQRRRTRAPHTASPHVSLPHACVVSIMQPMYNAFSCARPVLKHM